MAWLSYLSAWYQAGAVCLPAPAWPSGWWIGSARALRGHRDITCGVEDDAYDVCGRGDQRRVVDRAGAHVGAHPLGLEELGFRADHAVLFSDQDPARSVFPQGTLDRDADGGASREPVPVAWVGAF